MADFDLNSLFELILSEPASDSSTAIPNFIKKLSAIKIDIQKHMSFTRNGISSSIFSHGDFVFDKNELLSRAKEISNFFDSGVVNEESVVKSDNAESNEAQKESNGEAKSKETDKAKETDEPVAGFKLGFDSDDED